MNFGLPYMGSKSRLARRIVAALPPAPRLYDLFCGGGAVSHCALLSRKWDSVLANDVRGGLSAYLKAALSPGYSPSLRWVSREDFAKAADDDWETRLAWSFCYGAKSYLYSFEIEPWKRAVHRARVDGDHSELEAFGILSGDASPAWIRAHHDECKKKYARWFLENVCMSDADFEEVRARLEDGIRRSSEDLRQYLIDALKKSGHSRADVDRYLGTNGMAGHYFGRSEWAFPTREAYGKLRGFLPALLPYDEVCGLAELFQSLQHLQTLQRLEHLQSLQSLEHLQRLQRLEHLQRPEAVEALSATCASYADIDCEPDAVVYCDPPYHGVSGYDGEFDHATFYDWARRQKALAVISEYSMPSDFVCVAEFPLRVLFGRKKERVVERLFVPAHQSAEYARRVGWAKQLTLFD